MNIKYQITQDSISVVIDGKPHVVQRGTPNFFPLGKALMDGHHDEVPKYLTVAKAISEWAKGEFTITGNEVFFKGLRLPSEINTRIVEMASRGDDPTAVMNFWERLQKNPSYRSVQQLWRFLQTNLKGHPLQPDGRFLAYKGVRQDYMDQYSGKFLNKPGAIMKMPRNQVSDDYNVECHEGFHVGAIGYATNFAARTMIVIVDPEHVVSVPLDHHSQKMRVCEYEVKGNSNGEILPERVFQDEIRESKDEDEEDETEDQDDDEDDATRMSGDSALEACKESGKHMTNVDDDGYCNFCEEQDGADEKTDNPDDAEDDKNWEEDGKTPKKVYPSHVDPDKLAPTSVGHKHAEVKDDETPLVDEEKELVAAGNVIGAIKLVRERLHCGLLEAKNAVEAYRGKKGVLTRKFSDSMKKVATKPAPEKKPAKGWAKFAKMSMKDLMEQSIEDLRQYAGKGLDIVGSSKIPGGKTALVSRILKVRD